MAAGCGGSVPWTMESPAISGMPTRIGGRPLRRAAAATMGSISTNPTSKKTGMPTRMPSPISAHGRPFSPQPSTNVVPSAVAPPERASRLPRMAPRPSTMAMWPSRPPTPEVKDKGTCCRGMPEATPRLSAATHKATAGCRRTQAIRIRRSTTVPAAQASRNQLGGTMEAARGTHALFHTMALQRSSRLC